MPHVHTNIEKALIDKCIAVLKPYRVSWPNIAYKPPADNSLHLRVFHFPNASERLFLKRGPEYRQGMLSINVIAPKGEGKDFATQVAGDIALLFPADLNLWHGGVRVQVQKEPDVMSASENDVSWNVPVTIRYEAVA